MAMKGPGVDHPGPRFPSVAHPRFFVPSEHFSLRSLSPLAASLSLLFALCSLFLRATLPATLLASIRLFEPSSLLFYGGGFVEDIPVDKLECG